MDTRGMILSTASSVEGYRVIRQLGIVFGETVIRHDVPASSDDKNPNTAASNQQWSGEVAGAVEPVRRAREHACEKMIDEAGSRGANAIIAIDSDNTFGDHLMYLSLHGTAVEMIPEEEYYRRMGEGMRRKLEEKRGNAEKQGEKDQTGQVMTDDLGVNLNCGGMSMEKKFLAEIASLDSMIEIWKTWERYDLASTYPEADNLIKKAKEIERMYGRSVVTVPEKITKIREILGA